MPLSPQDIVRKEFREAFRGYNQADVDLFLDEVVDGYTRLSEENQKMKVRLVALQQEVARIREGRPAGSAPAPGAPSPDPAQIETEVRARLRRFFEDQIRSLEAGSPLSATAQRLARDLPTAAEPEAAPRRPPPPPKEPEQPPARPPGGAEPFWAGE